MKSVASKMKEKLSVCIPVYNGERTIAETIQSVLSQSLRDFELLIVDNASVDNTVNVVKGFNDSRIRLVVNKQNLGLGGNLEECRRLASGDILFFLSADDLARKDALLKVRDAFNFSDNIGIVTRPYFWFEGEILKPVRVTAQFKETEIVSLDSPPGMIRDAVSSFDQISGVAFRKKYMIFEFGREPFIEIARMACPMIKVCKVVILRDNIVAIRIGKGTMIPVVYRDSPMMAWYRVIAESFPEARFDKMRRYLIRRLIANNYVGLIQIKSFGTYKYLFREIYALIWLRPDNILCPQFWFFVLGTVLLPSNLLRRLTPWYKKNINSAFINQEILKGWS